jgi:hypothetical protein
MRFADSRAAPVIQRKPLNVADETWPMHLPDVPRMRLRRVDCSSNANRNRDRCIAE